MYTFGGGLVLPNDFLILYTLSISPQNWGKWIYLDPPLSTPKVYSLASLAACLSMTSLRLLCVY